MLAFATSLVAGQARAQDFAAASAPAHRMLEDGIAPRAGGFTAEAGFVQWHRIAGLTTRSVALAGSWREARAGLGASQTGDPEIGWMSAAAAVGVATPLVGAGLRALGRRDRTAESEGTLGRGVGLEVGLGAWAVPAAGLDVWASAPQAWRRGGAPPLVRALEIGGRLEQGALAGWIARGAPPTALDRSGHHRAGLALAALPWRVWIEARDQPLRGALGVAVAVRGFHVAATVEGHPVLDETVRIVVGQGRGEW